MPRNTKLVSALPTEAEILEASEWRLADWSYEETARAQCVVESVWAVFQEKNRFSSDDCRIKPWLESIKRADRRDPWTALCALLALESDARNYNAGIYRAGLCVLDCLRQAIKGEAKRAVDSLDSLIIEYLKNHRNTASGELFSHFSRLAGMHPVIESANSESITYIFGRRTKIVNRGAFSVRVSRARKRIDTQIDDPGMVLGNVFLRSYQQPVAVMAAD